MKKLVALVLAALMLFACTALAEIDPSIPTDQTTEVVFWHSFTGDDEATLLAQIEAFQAEYPYIAVKPQYIGGYNDIHTELASANAAGVGVPALCVINVPRLTSYAKDDVVEDLNPYIEAFADQINFADFYDGMTTAMNNDGKQTALPFGQSGQIFYYNKTLLSELGVTFPEKLEDMDAFLKTVSEATGKPALEIHGSDNAYFYCMFCNLGAYMIDVDTNTTGLGSEVALDLIKRIRSWVDAGYVKWVDTDVGNTLRLDFTSGATASVLYTSSLYSSYKAMAEAGTNGAVFEVGIANQPMGITNYQFVAGATLILPSCECNTQAQKNAAFLLASYLTSPKQQLEWATVSSYYVTRKSASTDPQYTEAYQALLEELPETAVIDLNSYVSKTKHPLFDKCGDVFENYMSEIMNNGMDPEEGWEMMVEEINDTLADA